MTARLRRFPTALRRASALAAFWALATTPAFAADIHVSPPKLFDVRELETMLRVVQERLAQINALGGDGLAAAIGKTQGGEVASSTIGLSATTLPTPAVETGGKITTDAAGKTTSESTTKATDAAISPTALAPPAPPAVLAASTQHSPNARDLLGEQVSLTYKLLNLRMLLDRSVTDRVDFGAVAVERWIGKSSSDDGDLAAIPRERILLGFEIDIDPQRHYRDAVAEVLVTVRPREAVGEAAWGTPRVMALMPERDTYNVATMTRKAREAKLGAIAGVVNLGLGVGRSRETFFLVKDVDTVAFQAPTQQPNAAAFGWRFQPVLGARVVEPGPRQVFAVLSFPDFGGRELRDLDVAVTTRWRPLRGKKRAGRTLGSEPLPGSIADASHALAVPTGAFLDKMLRPIVEDVVVTDAGAGNLFVQVKGAQFNPGTQVLFGSRALADADGLRIAGAERMRFLVPAAEVAGGQITWLAGRYGEIERLLHPGSRAATTLGPVLAIGSTTVRRLSGTVAELALHGVSGLPPGKLALLEIGGEVFGLRSRPLLPCGERCLAAQVPAQLLFRDDRATLSVPFYDETGFRAEAVIPLGDLFQIGALEDLGTVAGRRRFALVGDHLLPAALQIQVGGKRLNHGDFLECRPLGACSTAPRLRVTFEVGPSDLVGVELMVLSQGDEVQLVRLAPKPPKPASLALRGEVRQNDSVDVELTGEHLDSVAEIRFEAAVLELRRDGSKVFVTVSRDVTAKAGRLQLTVVGKDGSRQHVPFEVIARA
ncbi:MAG: hypothetical protein ACRD2T_10790 [Thermoanaerobaculia bacterium]